MSRIGSGREANRLFFAGRKTGGICLIARKTRALRFASSPQAARYAQIFRHLQIVGKRYGLCGGAR